MQVLTSSCRFRHPADERAGALISTRSVNTQLFPTRSAAEAPTDAVASANSGSGPSSSSSSASASASSSSSSSSAAVEDPYRGKVVAEILIAGFRIRPLPTSTSTTNGSSHDAPRCRLTMISHVDFGGNMPAQLINYVQVSYQRWYY